MARIDLHAHSTASDGSDSPAELVAAAVAAGLDVLALTDHDTVGGHAEAAAALPNGLTLIPGAELSCSWQGTSVHLLAYLFDPAEPTFAAERDRLGSDRVRRAREMVRRLTELGAPVTWEQVARIAGDGAVGRPHVAKALVEAGVVASVEAAFTADWIGHGGRAHVDKYALDPARAVPLVHGAGGVAVLAHPRPSAREYVLPDTLIADLATAGLDGIEVDHPDHDQRARARLRGLAGELDLVITGSSDYHGTADGERLGANVTDPECYAALVDAATGAQPVRTDQSRVR